MEARSLPVRKLARVLIAMSCILLPVAAPAQSASTRPLIALFEPFGPKADTTLAAALSTVADSVELDLTCLQRFDVRRLPARDPARDMGSVRSYCRANRIDQAILGSGISQASGGYAFTLMLYDRRTDAVTMVQEGACSGALDMFDTTDTLVAALLDKLSGEHLLFGALVIETDPPGAVVTLNGKELGASPLSLRGLPVGPVTVSARSPGWEEGSSTVKVEDNQTSSISLKLARSMGTLRLDMPEDAYVTVRSADVPERILWGPTSEELPTGSYQLEATCPGLATVRQGITVARDSTVSFRPWEKGYLEVRPDVDGVSVSVDGTPRGTAPLVLEMDPGVLHRVVLTKDKYQSYQAELSAAAARKVSFEPELTLTPGSIRVQTTPAGAWARLDGGEFQKTPCTFPGVQPGSHEIAIDDLLVNKRYYTSARKFSVEVKPAEEATLSTALVPGNARVSLDSIPPDCTVTVDGSAVDAKQLLTPDGVEVPAGSLDFVVRAPSGQGWKNTLLAASGNSLHLRLQSMGASLARRTIKVDGKTDDWDGILPTWEIAAPSDRFPSQPGTEMTRAYLCRDDANIYVRMDFDDGTPLSGGLTRDIQATLCYEIQVRLSGKNLIANVNASRRWGTNTWMGIWNDATRSTSNLSNSLSYSIRGTTLEMAVPWRFAESYLKDQPWSATLDVVDAGETSWISSWVSGPVTVDFVH